MPAPKLKNPFFVIRDGEVLRVTWPRSVPADERKRTHKGKPQIRVVLEKTGNLVWIEEEKAFQDEFDALKLAKGKRKSGRPAAVLSAADAAEETSAHRARMDAILRRQE